jgi:hypothetical protein
VFYYFNQQKSKTPASSPTTQVSNTQPNIANSNRVLLKSVNEEQGIL